MDFDSKPFLTFKSIGWSDPAIEADPKAVDKIECTYRPLFSNPTLLYEMLDVCHKAKEKGMIPPEKLWMGIYYSREIEEGLHPRLAIRKVDDVKGFGLFAGQPLGAHFYVGEYTGVVMPDQGTSEYSVRYPKWALQGSPLAIEAKERGNYTRFINHEEKEPNLELVSVYWKGLARLIFLTTRSIKSGEELVFDYN